VIETRPAFEAQVAIGAALMVGMSPHGFRRVVPIVGGTFEGARARGRVLPFGADVQAIRPDGVMEVEARYGLETHDGVTILVVNRGILRAPPDVFARLGRGEDAAPSEYYFRTCAQFDAPLGSPYEWLNGSLFVSRVVPKETTVHVDFHELV